LGNRGSPADDDEQRQQKGSDGGCGGFMALELVRGGCGKTNEQNSIFSGLFAHDSPICDPNRTCGKLHGC
jgi:hypothetical protein